MPFMYLVFNICPFELFECLSRLKSYISALTALRFGECRIQ